MYERIYTRAPAMGTVAAIVFMVWLRAGPKNMYFDGFHPVVQ
jgi:hypothetical protein